MTSRRLITTSVALASAIVLANGLSGCDYMHRTFGIGGGDSSSGDSGPASSTAGSAQSATQGSPMYPNGYQQSQNTQSQNGPSASSTAPGTGTGSSSTMSSNPASSGTSATGTSSMSSASAAPAAAATTPDEIKQAQQALADQGLYKGKVDGIVGPQTRRAVRQFQKSHSLSQTAQLDADTMQALNGGQVTNSGASK
ncbi:MAG TPA: peptidoglycan-binding domain-containing protein [Candidatus Sulfotelmatobacter sp.]|nr:peptidoglycan-binding domain-containing protein [Candidatus Sulfotelmatobacter sp.]